jgi:four helix bundle protein
MYSYRRLDAWKRAHQGMMLTLKATDQAYHPRSRALFDQLKRAAISVEANIVEGYALRTAALFRRDIRIAIGSAAEAECLTRAAGEAGHTCRAFSRLSPPLI